MNGYTTTDEKSTEAEDRHDEFTNRQLRAVEEYLTVIPEAVDGSGLVEVVGHTKEKLRRRLSGRAV